MRSPGSVCVAQKKTLSCTVSVSGWAVTRSIIQEPLMYNTRVLQFCVMLLVSDARLSHFLPTDPVLRSVHRVPGRRAQLVPRPGPAIEWGRAFALSAAEVMCVAAHWPFKILAAVRSAPEMRASAGPRACSHYCSALAWLAGTKSFGGACEIAGEELQGGVDRLDQYGLGRTTFECYALL